MAESNASTTRHVSVLLAEVVDALRPRMPGTFLDCTLGGGGHTRAILGAHRDNKVVAVDRDSRAIERAAGLRLDYGERFVALHAPFSGIRALFSTHRFDGVVADLGVSTDQIFERRGFSFRDEVGLDMRMDERQEVSAADVVNTYSEQKLFVALKRGGVGREARAVARGIVKNRPIATAADLASLVSSVLHGEASKSGAHPATVVFQAIRIEVNDELGELEAFLASVPDIVNPGARLAVITFHSLEDQVVTSTMRQWEGADNAPAWWPGASRAVRRGACVSRKPVIPNDDEVVSNPAARSARLRVFEFAA